MTTGAGPKRSAVTWSSEARANMRAIELGAARQILNCVTRYLTDRSGDVKRLKPPLQGFRLRCGDYRVFFELRGDNAIEISAVMNRRDAYR